MRIGIIGAGNIGSTLTRRLTALGHQVSVANSRHPETLADLAAETGATAVSAGEASATRVAVRTVDPWAMWSSIRFSMTRSRAGAERPPITTATSDRPSR